MKVVLFCGGYGMRMRCCHGEGLPKPLQPVGDRLRATDERGAQPPDRGMRADLARRPHPVRIGDGEVQSVSGATAREFFVNQVLPAVSKTS